MMTKKLLSLLCGVSLCAILASCSPSEPPKPEEPPAPPPRPAGSYHVYVTNERSGDLTIIDSVTHELVDTVPR
jgi:YVTN family beta-propeller protein